MVIDPIADLLTRMRNAFAAKQNSTLVPFSKQNLSILAVLKKHHFIADFHDLHGKGSFGSIEVTFNREKPTLSLKRVSKPGQRIYIQKKEIKSIRNGYGISVLSTPRGVMSGDEANKAGVGGEYICEVW